MRGSRDYCQGVQVQPPENSSENVFFSFFKSSTYFTANRGFPMVTAKKKNVFQGFSGGPTFSGGGEGPSFSRGGGGPNAFFIEIHITCDFPGGGPDPLSPLWIRTCNLYNCYLKKISFVSIDWIWRIATTITGRNVLTSIKCRVSPETLKGHMKRF